MLLCHIISSIYFEFFLTYRLMTKKWYVVYIGRRPGVYDEWSECQAQVNRFPCSSYKGFQSKSEAEASYLRFTVLYVERNKNGSKTTSYLLSFLSRWLFSCIATYCSFDPSWNMHVWFVLETCTFIFHDDVYTYMLVTMVIMVTCWITSNVCDTTCVMLLYM